VAAANQAADANRQQIKDADAEIERLEKQLADAESAKAKFDQGLADATRKGLTGAAAEEHARAQVEKEKGKKVALIVGTIALAITVVVLVLWWVKKRKKA